MAMQQIREVRSRGASALAEDPPLLEALRRGDQVAFTSLLAWYHDSMLRRARFYVPTRVVAEEVVQETWLQVLRGLPRFQERSSLKTWLFRILINRAKSCGQREARSIPVAWLNDHDELSNWGEVEVVESGETPRPYQAYRWTLRPTGENETPEGILLWQERLACIREAVAKLPANQRLVIILHDIEEWTPREICDHLRISAVNQRVLLHRARSRVRGVLKAYLDDNC